MAELMCIAVVLMAVCASALALVVAVRIGLDTYRDYKYWVGD